MIRSVQTIKGVGRYANYTATELPLTQQPHEFKKMNLIYGKNGTGKTTFTHIFRSLKGNDELLLKKIAFNYTGSPDVQLLTDSSNNPSFHYQAFKWNLFEPHLEIFDVHFINDHIYTGMEIQSTHKKKLFEIILGEQGIQLKQTIQDTKIRIQKGNKIVRETGKALEQAIGPAFTALDYIEVAVDPDIEEKIEWKRKELSTVKNHQLIQAKSSLATLPIIKMPFEKVKATAILQQSLDFISADYLDKFQAHKARLDMGGKAEEWLQQGFESQYDDQCPFCLQPMEEGIAIIKAYQQYFSATYKQLVKDIGDLHRVLAASNLTATFSQIDNVLALNKELIAFWETYLSKIPQLSTISEEQQKVLTAYDKVTALFEQKMRNPVEAVPITDVQVYEQAMQEAIQQINAMNEAIVDYNERISLLKEQEDTDVARVEMELRQLLAIQQRADPTIDQYCKDLKKYTAAITKLKQQTKDKNKELNEYKEQIFTTYLSTLNRHLEHFAPYLKLQKLTSSYMGSSTEPAVKFALCIHDQEVTHAEKGNQVSMKYSLSEGDKNALALSFFLTKLELDTDLKEKIIVFDDPVSSFDANRLSKMLAQLIHFGQQAKQLFFLTHNDNLALELVKVFQKEKIDYSTNQLLLSKDGTVISKYDI